MQTVESGRRPGLLLDGFGEAGEPSLALPYPIFQAEKGKGRSLAGRTEERERAWLLWMHSSAPWKLANKMITDALIRAFVTASQQFAKQRCHYEGYPLVAGLSLRKLLPAAE